MTAQQRFRRVNPWLACAWNIKLWISKRHDRTYDGAGLSYKCEISGHFHKPFSGIHLHCCQWWWSQVFFCLFVFFRFFFFFFLPLLKKKKTFLSEFPSLLLWELTLVSRPGQNVSIKSWVTHSRWIRAWRIEMRCAFWTMNWTPMSNIKCWSLFHTRKKFHCKVQHEHHRYLCTKSNKGWTLVHLQVHIMRAQWFLASFCLNASHEFMKAVANLLPINFTSLHLFVQKVVKCVKNVFGCCAIESWGLDTKACFLTTMFENNVGLEDGGCANTLLEAGLGKKGNKPSLDNTSISAFPLFLCQSDHAR